MNRRNFLSKLGIGAAAVCAAPMIIKSTDDTTGVAIEDKGRSPSSYLESYYDFELRPQTMSELVKIYGNGFSDKSFIELRNACLIKG